MEFQEGEMVAARIGDGTGFYSHVLAKVLGYYSSGRYQCRASLGGTAYYWPNELWPVVVSFAGPVIVGEKYPAHPVRFAYRR